MNQAIQETKPAPFQADGRKLDSLPGSAYASPLLSLSLDLDNLWSYQKTHGDAGWESFPSYLDPLAEIVLDRLKKHGLVITFFVVGQDAALEKNWGALRAISGAGHEIGNHSFHHEPWLHLYSAQEIEAEIRKAEEHIERATGRRPRGFRGPGFSLSPDTLRVLSKRGYLYDASTFPTFLGPLARAYYFWNTRGLSAEEKGKRKKLFGSVNEGFRPVQPYFWELEPRKDPGFQQGPRSQPLPNGKLVEIPVTTMPFFRFPIHLSYLIYLARFSKRLSRAYLRWAMTLCRLTSVDPSFLLHPLDFLGADHVRELGFFPGMDLSTDFKLRFFDEVMGYLKRRFLPITMEEHAQAASYKLSTRSKRVDAE